MKKLEQGDYVKDLTERQFNKIIEIEGNAFVLPFSHQNNRLFYDGEDLLYLISSSMTEATNPISFDEFKQRAINTFKSC
jgi:hypothetical protein